MGKGDAFMESCGADADSQYAARVGTFPYFQIPRCSGPPFRRPRVVVLLSPGGVPGWRAWISEVQVGVWAVSVATSVERSPDSCGR